MKRKRILRNEKRRESRNNSVESTDMKRKRLMRNEKEREAKNKNVETTVAEEQRLFQNDRRRIMYNCSRSRGLTPLRPILVWHS
jgi:hypothetical protein